LKVVSVVAYQWSPNYQSECDHWWEWLLKDCPYTYVAVIKLSTPPLLTIKERSGSSPEKLTRSGRSPICVTLPKLFEPGTAIRLHTNHLSALRDENQSSRFTGVKDLRCLTVNKCCRPISDLDHRYDSLKLAYMTDQLHIVHELRIIIDPSHVLRCHS